MPDSDRVKKPQSNWFQLIKHNVPPQALQQPVIDLAYWGDRMEWLKNHVRDLSSSSRHSRQGYECWSATDFAAFKKEPQLIPYALFFLFKINRFYWYRDERAWLLYAMSQLCFLQDPDRSIWNAAQVRNIARYEAVAKDAVSKMESCPFLGTIYTYRKDLWLHAPHQIEGSVRRSIYNHGFPDKLYPSFPSINEDLLPDNLSYAQYIADKIPYEKELLNADAWDTLGDLFLTGTGMASETGKLSPRQQAAALRAIPHFLLAGERSNDYAKANMWLDEVAPGIFKAMNPDEKAKAAARIYALAELAAVQLGHLNYHFNTVYLDMIKIRKPTAQSYRLWKEFKLAQEESFRALVFQDYLAPVLRGALTLEQAKQQLQQEVSFYQLKFPLFFLDHELLHFKATDAKLHPVRETLQRQRDSLQQCIQDCGVRRGKEPDRESYAAVLSNLVMQQGAHRHPVLAAIGRLLLNLAIAVVPGLREHMKDYIIETSGKPGDYCGKQTKRQAGAQVLQSHWYKSPVFTAVDKSQDALMPTGDADGVAAVKPS